MSKEKTYNKNYLRKVLNNKLFKFIKEKEKGLYYIRIIDLFPKNYNIDLLIEEYFDEYEEIGEIFANTIANNYLEAKNISVTPIVDMLDRTISLTDWTIIIKEGYKEDLKEIKKRIKENK